MNVEWNPSGEVTTRQSVCDGKYTFLAYSRDYRIFVLRRDEPWLVIEVGHNAVMSLLREVEELRAQKESRQ